MKKISSLLLFLSLFIFSGCDYEYIITESEIQEALTNLFPLEKETFLLTFTLTDPEVTFDEATNRIELHCQCVGQPVGNWGQFDFPLHFSTDLLFEDNSNSIYFHDIQIETNTAERIPSRVREMILPALTNFTNEIVDEYPIYSINDASRQKRFAQRFCRDVIVRDSSIVMIFARD